MNVRVLLLIAVVGVGCARVPDPALSPFGAPVELSFQRGAAFRGELLAVSAETVWVRTAGSAPRTAAIAMNVVTRVRVDRNGTGSPGLTFGVLFGLGTGAMMEAACGSVGGSCNGVILLVSLGVSMILGAAVDGSANVRTALVVAPPTMEALQPFARFPQGLPAQFR